MAQQASPKVTGQTELLRTQLTAKSSDGQKHTFRLLKAVVDFLEFGAVFGAALQRSEQIAIAFLRSPPCNIL